MSGSLKGIKHQELLDNGLANRMLQKAVLTINAGGALTVKTTAVPAAAAKLYYTIAGVVYSQNDLAAQVLDARLVSYFQQGDWGLDALPPPDLGAQAGPYAELVRDCQMNTEERLILLLALIPHVRPQLLDALCLRNKELDRPFTEEADGRIANQVRLRIANRSESDRSYQLSIVGAEEGQHRADAGRRSRKQGDERPDPAP